ncbi:SRPBCC domain-containing protein [Streptomyces muensis]|uniref:Carbon monoxide dehydrogenase n=1 Tax=Streptomyces muensis TaxID=1077944 RepID=A0A9X1TS58_STRM4|nr:SRPBCC domain-containing protein [Streptomyces muensis]MCF1600564.1 carbon monoxide dehydrogenase [Streptomyces muensis]
MEHEVFVPVAAERLREVLADPVRVARAVPGLQQDAGAEPVAGRLKVRVGGHTITYRGTARVSAREDGSYAVEGDATEARGTGSVKLALTVWVREAEEGSGGSGATVRFEGSASVDGRVAEFSADAVSAAVGRLLNRFGEQLGVVAEQEREEREESAADGGSAVETADDAADVTADQGLAPGEFETRVTSDFETTPDADDAAVPGPEVDAGDGGDAGEPPVAEAAHARRTMIGRSAEEVDHAPPRGRYAPVPAPQTVVPTSALRWAAPAAAVVLASAIVVSRVIRRRR